MSSLISADFDIMRKLPLELINEVLGVLGIEDLRALAGVSHNIRAVVQSHPNYYISLNLTSADTRVIHDEATAYAIRERLRIEIAVDLDWMSEQTATNVCNDLACALVTTVILSVTVPDRYRHMIDTALGSNPAPVLRSLALRRTPERHFATRLLPALSLPDELFQGHAPDLRSLTLSDFAFNAVPLRALALTRHADITYDKTQPPSTVTFLAQQLPVIQSLRISLTGYHASFPISLRGVKIRSLEVEESVQTRVAILSIVSTEISLPELDRIVLDRNSSVSDPYLWLGLNGPLQVRCEAAAREGQRVVTTVTEIGSGKRRILQGYFGRHIASLISLMPQLTSIRLNSVTVEELSSCARSLPALHTLELDMVSTKDAIESAPGRCGTGRVRRETYTVFGRVPLDQYRGDAEFQLTDIVSCDALEVFRMHGSNVPLKVEDAVYLSAAYGQASREEKDRARLELVGVRFVPGTDYGALRGVFSNADLLPRTQVRRRRKPLPPFRMNPC